MFTKPAAEFGECVLCAPAMSVGKDKFDLGVDRKSSFWGVWAAPVGPPPRSGSSVGGLVVPAGAAQTPKVDDFRSTPKPAPTKDTQRLSTQIRGSDEA